MKRKILFIGLGTSYGGVEQFTCSVCDSFLKDSYEFEFLNYYKVDEQTKDMIAKIGGKEYRVSRYSANPVRFLKEIHEFYRKHADYDAIYCNASYASVIFYTLPVWRDKRKKIVFHSHASDGNHKRLQIALRKLVNKFCDLKIAASESAALWMYGEGKEVQIVYSCIDAKRFQFRQEIRDMMREKYRLGDKLVIGHVGRLTEVKNHSFLLQVFKELLERRPNAFLVLIGEGELHEQIRNDILKMKLEEYVLMLPFQKNIQDYYQMMDIFVLPSLKEGMGLAGIEAQACGLSVFYSDGVPREAAITDLAHYLELKRAASEWAEKILLVKICDRSEYWKKVVEAGFDKEIMVKKVHELLRENEIDR